jgi:uncharacterized protein YidB (DUF937 family)
MGILDQVGGALGNLGGNLGGSLGGGANAGVSAILLQQVIAYLSKPGALDGVMASFQQHGLGNILQSWLGTGQNLPISGDQVKQVLGSGTIESMAQKAGVAMPDAANLLAGLLPQVIDKVSPGGSAPAGGELGGLLASVGKMFS